MLPISISNSRDLQRSDAKLSSDRSVKGSASKAAQSVFASSDDVINLNSFKPAATAPELMGMSRNKARSAYLNFGKQEAQEELKNQLFASIEENKNKLSALGRKELTPEEHQKVDSLKKQELKVMAKVNARLAAGGDICEKPRFTYETGPDGKRYKTAGEVKIDVSPCKTPEETISKMHRVMKAALAGGEPSDSDRAIYKEAQRLAQIAQNMLMHERMQRSKEEQEKIKKEIAARNGDADKSRLGGKILRTFDEIPASASGVAMPSKPQINLQPNIDSAGASVGSTPSAGSAPSTGSVDAASEATVASS